METRNQSRFSTLRVFKLPGVSKHPPPPPPKDGLYAITPYMTAGASTSQLTLNTAPSSSPDLSLVVSPSMRSPTSNDPRFPGSSSPQESPYVSSPVRSPQTTSGAFKKGLTKLSSFGKRPNKSQSSSSIPHSPSLSALSEQPSDSEGISAPWNFQHHIHVNGDLNGLPPEWSSTLADAGFSEQAIADLRARQRTAPPSDSSSRYPLIRDNIIPIINPKPRSDSLHRNSATASAASTSTLATINTATRRSPSPASSFHSVSVAPSTHTITTFHSTPSYAQSQAQSNASSSSPSNSYPPHLSPTPHSPTDSNRNSISHSSGRSRPPAPLPLGTLRIVNEDPHTPSSPPPAYASPTPTGGMMRVGAKAQTQRRGSMEKVGLHEAAASPQVMTTVGGDREQRVERREDVSELPRVESRMESEEETTVEHGHGAGGRGVVASENVQGMGPADVRDAVGAADMQDASIPPPAELNHTHKASADDEPEHEHEHEHDDTVTEETHDEDPADLPVPRPPSPLSLSRTATLPPRLSLHTERDDGWGDMFTFLPSTSVEGGNVEDATPSTAKPNKRMSKRVSISLKEVSLSHSPSSSSAVGAKNGGGGGIQSRRRSKRFSTTLAIIPPTGQSVNAIVSSGDSGGETRDVTSTLDSPLRPPREGHASGRDGSSSPNASSPTPVGEINPPSTYSRDHDQEPKSHPCFPHSQTKPSSTTTYPNTTTTDLLEVGVLTPDPAYPIADSPLWEEVRTLVRQGVSAPTGDRIMTTTATTSERGERVEDDLRQDNEVHARDPATASASAPHDIASPSEPDSILSMPMSMSPSSGSGSLQLPDSPEIMQPSSRFSDASSFQGRSRFSDVTEFMGPSRFSDATSFQGLQSRFSDATSFQGHSRFSDISMLESVAGGDQALKSRFSAWSTSHRSTAFFSPLEAMPESPPISQMPTKVPVASPTRTNSDLAHPFSILHTRKLTDLPPPRPPPKDDLPPPPVDAEQEQRYSSDDFRVSRLSSMSNISSAQIHGAKIATLTQANIVSAPILAQAQMQIPPRDSPPSSNASPPQSTLSKSAAFSPLSSPQTQRPPPLPLPPFGKILPSIVANQRIQEKRRQRTQDSQDSSGQQSQESGVEQRDGSPAASASSSSSSHSRSTSYSVGSAEVFESSFGYEGDPRSLSASATSYEEPLKSPKLPYLEKQESVSLSSSYAVDAIRRDAMQGERERERVQSPGSEDDVPLGYLRMKASQKVQSEVESGWLSDEDGVESVEDRRQDGRLATSEHEKVEDTAVVTPGGDGHGISLPTPSIMVNGFNLGDAETLSPHSDLQTHDQAQAQKTLPVVLATTLQEYIYLDFDPREMFTDLQEVAQGQYGSVYAAHVCSGVLGSQESLVAVKKVPIPAQGTPKIGQLQHELALMSQVRHKHILATDGLFFDFLEDVLWIRMELMERSLADVLVLSEEGLHLEERVIARFASDTLLALAYLCDLGIAHRDVRSDNLLINEDGILKLADFSNGISISRQDPLCSEIVGVHHWQAPEIRKGRYDASKVDIWSLGATVWEAAEGAPPFADVEDTNALGDRWPPLTRGGAYSDVFHDFLRLCSEPPATRPLATQLLIHPFIQQACPRDEILRILNLCRSIEEGVQLRPNGDA